MCSSSFGPGTRENAMNLDPCPRELAVQGAVNSHEIERGAKQSGKSWSRCKPRGIHTEVMTEVGEFSLRAGSPRSW